jgi:hypothetical protein
MDKELMLIGKLNTKNSRVMVSDKIKFSNTKNIVMLIRLVYSFRNGYISIFMKWVLTIMRCSSYRH